MAPHFGPSERDCAQALIALAIAEDVGAGDVTAEATIPADLRARAAFVARCPGVIAGLPVVGMLAERFGLSRGWKPLLEDGSRVSSGARLALIEGPARPILSFERTALNFLQRLSGVATMTARFVAEVGGTRAKILDTRKTTPGWRALEKYAVRCGGGTNHRAGLFDAVLIKDNHLASLAREADPIGAAVLASRRVAPNAAFVEVEVDTFDQLDRALQCGPDIVLLDNFGDDAVAEAVRRRDRHAPSVLLEASGGIELGRVASLARTGVDHISVGALTHSAPSLDIGLDDDA